MRLIIGILVVIMAVGSCSSKNSNEPEVKNVRVKVVTVAAVAGSVSERIPGSVRPALESQLEAKVAGRIVKIRVKEGDRVSSGETLAEVDGREIQAKLDQAIAAQTQAGEDAKRFAKLWPAGAVTKQELEAAEARAKMADAAVTEARTMVGYTKIVSPYDGVITKKFLQEGDLAAPGKPILSLEQQMLYRFEVDLPETFGESVSVGTALQVTLTGLDKKVQGVISEVSPVTDPNTRTFRVKLDLPSEVKVRSGQFGYADLATGADTKIVVPVAATRSYGQLELVHVVDDGRAVLRLVRTGKRQSGSIEILSGLADGDQLIISSDAPLVDGVKVEVVE